MLPGPQVPSETAAPANPSASDGIACWPIVQPQPPPPPSSSSYKGTASCSSSSSSSSFSSVHPSDVCRAWLLAAEAFDSKHPMPLLNPAHRSPYPIDNGFFWRAALPGSVRLKHEADDASNPLNVLVASSFLDADSVAAQRSRDAWADPSYAYFSTQQPFHTSVASVQHQSSLAAQLASSTYRKKFKLPEEATIFLRDWFLRNLDHPYPNDAEKVMMMQYTGLTRTQVNNWFSYARRKMSENKPI